LRLQRIHHSNGDDVKAIYRQCASNPTQQLSGPVDWYFSPRKATKTGESQGDPWVDVATADTYGESAEMGPSREQLFSNSSVRDKLSSHLQLRSCVRREKSRLLQHTTLSLYLFFPEHLTHMAVITAIPQPDATERYEPEIKHVKAETLRESTDLVKWRGMSLWVHLDPPKQTAALAH
jgi:hypothetical protein